MGFFAIFGNKRAIVLPLLPLSGALDWLKVVKELER
jgi:hypothetical protein